MSKAEKLRGRLASIQRDREEFEKQKKELEEQMNYGRQNIKNIKKGLKNNEIINDPTLVSESATVNNNSNTVDGMTRKPSQRRESTSKGPNSKPQEINVNGSSSHNLSAMSTPQNNGANASGMNSTAGNGHLISHLTSPTQAPNNVMPSGPRVSEWCFSGPIDSSPPVVKSRELYESVRLLGRGSFGEVSLVKNIEDNKLFAIKTIFCAKDSDMQAVMHEVKFLRLNRHPCIIDIHDAFLMTNPRVMHIVMHYCESGSISSYISNAKKNKNSISESQIIKWVLQLGLALHFMHENNHTLHRDLKPMNVMLTEGGDLVKLADFGLALNMDENSKHEANEEAGTPYYTAPEMIRGESYSYPADCWSFGIIVHQLLTLERPFEGTSTATLVKAILTDEPPGLPVHYSDDIKAISWALLKKDPAERLTMGQLLADPFMHSKAASFPSSYRPRTLEERIRRSHVKTLEHQLQLVSRSSRGVVHTYKEHLAKMAATLPAERSESVSSPAQGIETPSGKFRKIPLSSTSNGEGHTKSPALALKATSERDMTEAHNRKGSFTVSEKKYGGHVCVPADEEGGDDASLLTSRTNAETEQLATTVKIGRGSGSSFAQPVLSRLASGDEGSADFSAAVTAAGDDGSSHVVKQSAVEGENLHMGLSFTSTVGQEVKISTNLRSTGLSFSSPLAEKVPDADLPDLPRLSFSSPLAEKVTTGGTRKSSDFTVALAALGVVEGAGDSLPRVSFDASRAAKLTHHSGAGGGADHSYEMQSLLDVNPSAEQSSNSLYISDPNTPIGTYSPSPLPRSDKAFAFGYNTQSETPSPLPDSSLRTNLDSSDGLSGKVDAAGLHLKQPVGRVGSDLKVSSLDNSPLNCETDQNTPKASANTWAPSSSGQGGNGDHVAFLAASDRMSSMDTSSHTLMTHQLSAFSVTTNNEDDNTAGDLNISVNTINSADLDQLQAVNSSMSAIPEEDLPLTLNTSASFSYPEGAPSSANSAPGGRKGQKIAEAKQTDEYYEAKLND